jgi:hypothetical protein
MFTEWQRQIKHSRISHFQDKRNPQDARQPAFYTSNSSFS